MNRFVIIDGLPYLFSHGSIFTVCLNKVGFTVGKKVKMPEIPTVTYSELSVRAKCETLSSIPAEVEQEVEQPEQPETEKAEDESEQTAEEQPKQKTARSRRRAVKKE